MLGRLAAQPAVDEENAVDLPSPAASVVDVRPADRIEHDARALAAGDPHDFGDEIGFLGRDHMLRALAFSASALLLWRVAAIDVAPAQFASWIAASPTLLEAARMMT